MLEVETTLRLFTLISCIALLGLAVLSKAQGHPSLEEAARYKGWQIKDFELDGLSRLQGFRLRSGLACHGEARFFGLLGRKRPALSSPLLESDLQRIRLYLARRGYPRAQIQVDFLPDAKERELELRLRIERGEAICVGTVQIHGAPGGLDSLLQSRLELKPGQVFHDAGLKADTGRLETALREQGFALASSEGRADSLKDDRVRLDYRLTPGPPCRIVRVEATGVAPDLRKLAMRQLRTLKDRDYDPERITEVRDRLRLLNLFREIRLDLPADSASGQEGDRVLRAKLASRKPITIQSGIGYWSDEGPRVEASWKHANLFKVGRGMETRGSLSPRRQTGQLRFWWPTLAGRLVDGETSYRIDRQNENSFKSLERTLRLGLNWRPTLQMQFLGGIGFSDVRLSDLSVELSTLPVEPLKLTTFYMSALHDNSDDPFHPTRGGVHSLRLEWTVPGFLSDVDLIRLEGERTAYHAVGGIVFAFRLHGGAAWPIAGSSELLPTHRFYAGGGSHRGFSRRGLGPLDDDDGPLGGRFLAITSLEARIPLPGRFSMALFVDAGQVWSRQSEIAADDLEVAAGPALLLSTPVGPLRVDWGHRLGAGDDRPSQALHFSIGHPF